MGIVAVISLAAGLGFLLSLQLFLKKQAVEEDDENASWVLTWGSRLCAIIALCGAVGVVDAYVYPLPSPFAPEEAELPDKPEKPAEQAEAPEIKKAEKPDPMKAAKEQHAKDLDEFQESAKQ